MTRNHQGGNERVAGGRRERALCVPQKFESGTSKSVANARTLCVVPVLGADRRRRHEGDRESVARKDCETEKLSA